MALFSVVWLWLHVCSVSSVCGCVFVEHSRHQVAQEQEAEAAAQSLQAADTSTNSVLQALARRQRVVSVSANLVQPIIAVN